MIQGEPPPWSSRVSAIRLKFIAVHCCTISLRCGLWNPNDNTEINNNNNNNDNNDNLVLGHPVPLQHVLALFLTLPRYFHHICSLGDLENNVRLWNNFPLSAETQVACPSAEPLHQVFFFLLQKSFVWLSRYLLPGSIRTRSSVQLSEWPNLALIGVLFPRLVVKDWARTRNIFTQAKKMPPDWKHFHSGKKLPPD